MTSLRTVVIGLLLLLLAGCKSAGIETSQEAANVYLSTYPAVAWKEVADKLEPRLDLAPEVSRAFTVEGYHAHLVTLQVALQPKARNLPYDVYLNITMYPGITWKEAVSPAWAKLARGGPPAIMVYPLSISEPVDGVGIDALATVGRVSDNSLRIRFGAHDYGTSTKGVRRYGILPRTHNVSMVVITRAAAINQERIASLLVVSETEIVPVEGGKALPNSVDGRQPEQDRAEEVTKLVSAHGFALRSQCSEEPSKRRNDWALDLLRAVDRQDYPGLQQCLTYRVRGRPRNSPLPPDMDADAHQRLDRLVSDLIKLQAGARSAKMMVPLPAVAVAKPAPVAAKPAPEAAKPVAEAAKPAPAPGAVATPVPGFAPPPAPVPVPAPAVPGTSTLRDSPI
jgi:hypothetical protein